MSWFHAVALPAATMFAVYVSIKRKAPLWKHGALLSGCGLMLSGLWFPGQWSTILLLGGGVLFFLGVPRGLAVQTSPSIDRAPSPAGRAGGGELHVSFPAPRFFLGDVRVLLLLDGAAIHDGGFKAGIDVTVPVAPGQHRLESALVFGSMRRRRGWDVAVPPSGCDVILEYSRFWGNFAKGLRVDPPAPATAGSSAGAA